MGLGGEGVPHTIVTVPSTAQRRKVGSVFPLPSLPRSEATGYGGQARGAAWRLLSENVVLCICLFLGITLGTELGPSLL